jgi:hypothetical protein
MRQHVAMEGDMTVLDQARADTPGRGGARPLDPLRRSVLVLVGTAALVLGNRLDRSIALSAVGCA